MICIRLRSSFPTSRKTTSVDYVDFLCVLRESERKLHPSRRRISRKLTLVDRNERLFHPSELTTSPVRLSSDNGLKRYKRPGRADDHNRPITSEGYGQLSSYCGHLENELEADARYRLLAFLGHARRAICLSLRFRIRRLSTRRNTQPPIRSLHR
jgi:hypothetical protein